jgi:hypothetical protein
VPTPPSLPRYGTPVVTTRVGSEGMRWSEAGAWGGAGGATDVDAIVEDAVRLYEQQQHWCAAWLHIQMCARFVCGSHEPLARTRAVGKLYVIPAGALPVLASERLKWAC